MKAVRVHEFGGPEVLKLEEVPNPAAAPGQVVVGVKAIGVNPVDTYIRAGTYTFRPSLPYTPGMDAAGAVEAVGQGVTRVREGDRVYVAGSLTGTYAAKTVCAEAQVHRLPAKISFAQGAAVNVPYATAYRAIFQIGQARAGETVFVHGASGGVGVAAVQLARAAGMMVIGTAGTAKGRELALREGAHHALDHTAPDYLEQLRSLTGGRGADVIIEMLANVNLGKDLPLLAARGRVVVVGNRGTVEINARDIMGKDGSIRGMSLLVAPTEELAGAHAAIYAGLENGTLRPIVGQEIPLVEAARAHKAVMEPGAHGKIVLIP
ncbi:MAG TPA: NADPH:quinone reductase [Candidatus Acidoferrales bacterium]|nr:NADPH:quinone reductase [Candidatus Acidoferrales bacterium]